MTCLKIFKKHPTQHENQNTIKLCIIENEIQHWIIQYHKYQKEINYYFDFSDSTEYVFHSTKTNYDGAKTACANAGFVLAMPKNEQEMNRLKDYLSDRTHFSSSDQVWIGLDDLRMEGTFQVNYRVFQYLTDFADAYQDILALKWGMI